MPHYLYRCLHCQTRDWRIAGLDDHLAICAVCGHAMAREDDDLFGPYFEMTSDQRARPAPRRKKKP